MSGYPRTELEVCPSPPFVLDRYAAYALMAFSVGGLVITLLNLRHGFVKAQDMGAVGPFAYLEKRWLVHLGYLMSFPATAWAGLALMRSRRWSILLLIYWMASSILYDVRVMYLYGLIGCSLFLVYLVPRLFGWLGPKPIDRYVGESG